MLFDKKYHLFLISLGLIFSLWTYQGYTHNYHKTTTPSSYVVGRQTKDFGSYIFKPLKVLCSYQFVSLFEFSFDILKKTQKQAINQTLKLQRFTFLSIKKQLKSITQTNTSIHYFLFPHS